MKEVYLDNAATTQPCNAAIKSMVRVMQENYGNPSSLHLKGIEAEKEIIFAKQTIASMINASENEIYFTSGGTEANNLAILGAIQAKKRLGNKIITTAIEHSSVYETISSLEKSGIEVVYLTPDITVCITKEQLFNAIDEKTILVSMMMVNNELGSIEPVEEIKKIVNIKKSPALVHVDAVQAFGKIPLNIRKIGADLISLSAHKVHGPKGIGALYKAKNARIAPIFFGGEQQAKLRPGTESTPLIAGFGAACAEIKSIEENYKHVEKINIYLKDKLKEIKNIKINSPENALPYILNFSIEGIKSETMLHFLSSHGIFVSSGSACAKGQKSRILTAINLPKNQIDSAIRVSFSKNNTLEEVNYLIEKIKEGIASISKS